MEEARNTARSTELSDSQFESYAARLDEDGSFLAGALNGLGITASVVSLAYFVFRWLKLFL